MSNSTISMMASRIITLLLQALASVRALPYSPMLPSYRKLSLNNHNALITFKSFFERARKTPCKTEIIFGKKDYYGSKRGR